MMTMKHSPILSKTNSKPATAALEALAASPFPELRPAKAGSSCQLDNMQELFNAAVDDELAFPSITWELSDNEVQEPSMPMMMKQQTTTTSLRAFAKRRSLGHHSTLVRSKALRTSISGLGSPALSRHV